MPHNNGTLAVSLDFELFWGVRDNRTVQGYEENLQGVKQAVEQILELFDKYEVHATWATVGFLFAKNNEELNKIMPTTQPKYLNTNLNPYPYIKRNNDLESFCHFAPHLIKMISNYENQEIGTHTFSHYYCLEEGQSIEEFEEDIIAAITTAKDKNLQIKSLVFPRNQWNDSYLSVLIKHGITSYRGNENGWLYAARNKTDERLLRRALRLVDSYIDLTGTNSYTRESIGTSLPYNIPSSRFLRPVSKKLALFEGLRKKRITNALTKAAQNGEIFHLWWHPHNFGINTNDNIKFLEDILVCFVELKRQYGMQSLNMGEISELISSKNE